MLLLLVTIAPALAAAGDCTPSRVTAEISTERRNYLLGEPVRVRLTVRNESTAWIETLNANANDLSTSVAIEGTPFHRVDGRGIAGNCIGREPVLFEPGDRWTFELELNRDHQRVGVLPAFPEPGNYAIQVHFPLMLAKESRTIPSPPLVLRIEEPRGDDRMVYREIERWDAFDFLTSGEANKSNRSMPLAMAHLLAAHPNSGYAEVLTRALRRSDYYGHFKDLHEREWLRELLGKPGKWDFVRTSPEMSPGYHDQLTHKNVENACDVASSNYDQCSPFFNGSYIGVKKSLDGRQGDDRQETVGSNAAGRFPVVWARRGYGNYYYTETLANSAERRALNMVLAPLPWLFPKDRRLDVEFEVDAPDRVPLDQVIASYARHSGIPLQASPFFARCVFAGGKQTLSLRSEMAFLERTFRARWEPRGQGYFLNAGPGTDDGDDPAATTLRPDPVASALLVMLTLPVLRSTLKPRPRQGLQQSSVGET